MLADACFQTAHQLRELLLSRQLSAVELLQAFEQQIADYNPHFNALMSLDFERAFAAALRVDQHLISTGHALGVLHGLPLAVKDIFHVAGFATTYGNMLYKDNISTHDSVLVQREKAAGAVIIGKSNTPDCASGGITQNEVFGLTRNPWNRKLTTSGSGGGGVAAGMVSLADGSDVGGSLRSPAALPRYQCLCLCTRLAGKGIAVLFGRACA